MIQDYHLFLAPRMLRTMRPDVRIGHFTHTPWVSADYFAMLPDDVAYAIVDGLLGADIIGLHTERWAELFRDTCRSGGRPRPGRRARTSRSAPTGGDAQTRARPDVDNELRVLERDGR